jgi:hypothetical protein
MVKINPNFAKEYQLQNLSTAAKKRDVQKRYDIVNTICGGRWHYCPKTSVDTGISYLSGIRGQPSNMPGPGNCGRVSCGYEAAIYWCNDVSYNCFKCIP